MTRIDRAGGTNRSNTAGARSASPSGEGQSQAQRIPLTHPASNLAAPEGLHRRTDSGHVPGESRPDAARAEASRSRAVPEPGGLLSSASVGGQARLGPFTPS